MVSHVNVKTVRELMNALMEHDPETLVKIRVDDGCGCCSSGGTLEEVTIEFDGKEIEIT
ncbi:hypothetical protein SEA_MOAB_169 [Streptomyces phage Moab]|nr:hypothetical protein SEA_MOAB_169 [Streptomyces phage Moab]